MLFKKRQVGSRQRQVAFLNIINIMGIILDYYVFIDFFLIRNRDFYGFLGTHCPNYRFLGTQDPNKNP